ncbi:hypothetical protein LWI28_021050 [Acer negundo]|uniref:Uncharacterized protein n=1 Tax=Acer negundo TaxID=4023 RepID=A0AAD5IS17_ACENE|nr:hypothetical protein LWI28_021050 [Acer negundo]
MALSTRVHRASDRMMENTTFCEVGRLSDSSVVMQICNWCSGQLTLILGLFFQQVSSLSTCSVAYQSSAGTRKVWLGNNDQISYLVHSSSAGPKRIFP